MPTVDPQRPAGRPEGGTPRGRGAEALGGALGWRWLLFLVELALGTGIVVWAGKWRAIETVFAAQATHLVTGERTVGASAANVLILYHGAALRSVFRVTSECSAAYLVGIMALVASPTALTRRLRWFAGPVALAVTALFVAVVNLSRLTVIGASVSWWGAGRGFSIGHTYLGTAITFAGVALAGALFTVVLLRLGRSHDAPGADHPAGAQKR